MNTGDPVTVTNLDGETAEGELVAVHDVTVSAKEADWWGEGERTLFEYWRGADIDPDDRVVSVRLGDSVYEYPESRVEVTDG